MNAEILAQEFARYSADRLGRSLGQLEACAALLDEEQMQSRSGDYENSIVNLLLHMEGNLRQWVLHGVGGQPDVRERDEEFVRTPAATGAAAMERMRTTLEEAQGVIAATGAARLMEITDPQPGTEFRHVTVMVAIAKAVGHLEHHAGQVILLTKQRAGRELGLTMPRRK